MKIKYGCLWKGLDWELAIRKSLVQEDCGIEEVLNTQKVLVAYQMIGWSNGYKRKYKTRIPKKYNEFVYNLLQNKD